MTSYDSSVIIISSSSLNHLMEGFGFPLNLRLKVALSPSVTVTFSNLPDIFGGSMFNL